MIPPTGIAPLCAGSALTGTAGDTYAIQRLLGTGGAGRVYLAEEGGSRRTVVVKIPRTWRQVEDLFAEARHTLRQELPHMARVHHIAMAASADHPLPVPILVMEPYRASLYEVLLIEGAIAPDEALRWMHELVHALLASQLLHRDLKLENVLVDEARHVWLCDWGLAIPANPEVRRRQDLRIEGIVGTFIYLAPEQIYEAPDIDCRADIYALGLMLFELVTGRCAHPRYERGMGEERYLRLLLTSEVPWQEVPHPAIAQIVRTCTAKRRADRFADHWMLLEAIDEARAGLGRVEGVPA